MMKGDTKGVFAGEQQCWAGEKEGQVMMMIMIMFRVTI